MTGLTTSDAETFSRCMSVGGVAVFPADTVYGLACEPDTPEAVRRLYAIKGRRPDKPAAVMFFSRELALEALPGLIARLGDVRFIVAGSGTAEHELREQASELGLDEHGTFLGWIGDDVLHSLYRIADLTVVPSIYEPFGLVALEAMASGCPCLVADTGGLREVVPSDERVGLRFHSRDPKSLGAMAERLLTDDALRSSMVAEAQEHVLTFDWADVARQTLEVYEGLAAPAVVRS